MEETTGKETTGTQQSSAGKPNETFSTTPSTKAANPSTLRASAEPFTPTPRSPPRQASFLPPQQLPYSPQIPMYPCDFPKLSDKPIQSAVKSFKKSYRSLLPPNPPSPPRPPPHNPTTQHPTTNPTPPTRHTTSSSYGPSFSYRGKLNLRPKKKKK
ncbi:hypothetical protein EUTSA_v10005066mg [Eutrema salsugineum]|uniref:Uncharacterized protein n=1 Tax=Eutrema salsugineum TaxID=72664 RepID=V4K0H0_EUTSA|nr:extensin [Eutrema salsugineum]ESQ31345.1 hypothetical protein EUTSA_v10005066mg [Eutrema salsugineum]